MEQPASTDEKIAARQQVIQAKMKRAVWVSSGLIMLMLVVYAVWQTIADKSSSETTAEQVENGETSTQTKAQYSEQKRSAFMQQMADIEENLLPLLMQTDFRNWAGDRLLALESTKTSALTNFANSHFSEAARQAEEFDRAANILLQTWHDEFDRELKQAWSFFNSGKIKQSSLAFERANNIKPNNPNSELLRNKLASYDDIAKLQQALQVAEVENNYLKQVEVLNDMLTLDPSLQDATNKLENVQSKLDKDKLSSLLNRVEAALKDEQLSTAHSLLTKAKLIDKNAAGIRNLAAKIRNLKEQQDLKKRTTQLNVLIKNQEWAAVTQVASQHLAKYPNVQAFKDALGQGENILTQQERISALTAQANRLEDANIRDIAVTRLKEALPFSLHSDELAKEVAKLASLLDKYAAEVEVDVRSDGESYVTVLGVGHVGQVEQKTIKLTPGNYTFEARRDGYKTRRLNVEIKNNTNNVVEVLSNEKI